MSSFIISYSSFSFKIVINSSWPISMSINAWDTEVSILFSLILARTSNLSCLFFLFLDILSNFLIIYVVKEKIKEKLALFILTGAPVIVLKEIIDTPPLVADKAIKILSM